jgi:hypothetical protein
MAESLENIRFLVDEESLDCNGLSSERLNADIARFADCLVDLRELEAEEEDAKRTGLTSGWGAIPCWGGDDLAMVLTGDRVDRDVGALLLGLLDKCTDIDDAAESVNPEVTVAGTGAESYGIALAHKGQTLNPAIALAVVTLAHRCRSGILQVDSGGSCGDVAFVTDVSDERWLWRLMFEVEDAPEAKFFDVARRAFPRLWFAPTLTFSGFDGGYPELRPKVVHHLSCLDDGWTEIYEEENGNSERITPRLGIDVSRESGKTRTSATLMRARDVEFDEMTYRCEWHSKIERHRNRIHFHPASDGLSRPLIGIFCNHLPTEG